MNNETQWERPTPLRQGGTNLLPFPVNALPPILREMASAKKYIAMEKNIKKLKKERDAAVQECDKLKAQLTAVSSELAAYKKAEEEKALFTREKMKKEAKRISREDELSRELKKAKAFISACGLSADYQQFRYNSTTRNNVLE